MADELDDLQKNIVKELRLVKKELLYVATVLREYGVPKSKYSSGKTLSELVAPAIPSEIEENKFKIASQKVSEAIKSIDEIHGQLGATEAVIDLYFNQKHDDYVMGSEDFF